MCAPSSRTRWPRWLVPLLLALLHCCSPLPAQTSPPLSPDTGPASAPITPTDELVSTIWLPLAEQVLTSSQASDAELLTLKRQKIADDEQRKIEQQQRKQESDDSAKALTEQSAKAERLQSLHSDLLTRLGSFSGSEAERQAAALAALDGIQTSARAMERENAALKVGLGVAGVVTVGAIIYAVTR